MCILIVSGVYIKLSFMNIKHSPKMGIRMQVVSEQHDGGRPKLRCIDYVDSDDTRPSGLRNWRVSALEVISRRIQYSVILAVII